MHKWVKVLLVDVALFHVSIAIPDLLSPQGVEGETLLHGGVMHPQAPHVHSYWALA